ncbi:hypothetical protein [Flagellimonas sp.]|uniref:hypothetical protein n=1 Tax=Flagellimonas sp. TaxID=2058762 RepID=UPI003F4A7897
MPNRPKPRKRPWRDDRKPFGRRKNNNYDFYNSTRWRKKSRLFREKNPFCEQCERENRVVPAEVVDHVKGLQFLLDNGMDPYADEELESMCHKCHNVKSGKQAHWNKKKKK